MEDTVVIFLSVDGSLISVVDYFIFEYIAPVFISSWPRDIPALMECAPSNLAPTEVGEVKLNWVVPGGSCGDVYVVSCTSSNGSPPGFF